MTLPAMPADTVTPNALTSVTLSSKAEIVMFFPFSAEFVSSIWLSPVEFALE